MDTDIFLNLFRQALSQVEAMYYGIDRRHNPIFARHDERVFCYELYHQMRSLMQEYPAGNPDSFSSLRFQGELRKERISVDTEEQFNVKALSKPYIPDFLLHALGRPYENPGAYHDIDTRWEFSSS
jgi:hypothetical protein